jgi:glycosyltransferase involved in cell wall biosynthesis
MDFRTKLKSDKPSVTIGVLSYNYSPYVIETLDSIYSQTYDQIQLIIIDDYSTDNSVALIKDWIKEKNVAVEFIVHEKNYGRNKACNTIIKKAEGKYLALFSSDDTMMPHRIEKQVEVMEGASGEYAVCYTDAELMNEKGEARGLYSLKHQLNHLEGDVFEQYYYRRFVICAPAIFFRTEIFKTIGNYDEKVTIEDYEMWMRLLPKFKVKYCNYVGIKYRIKESLTLTPVETLIDKRNYHRNRIIIYAKLFNLLQKENIWPSINKDVIRKINYHLIHLKDISTTDFCKILAFLIKNSFYKISVLKILKLQVKYSIVFYKPKPITA